MDSLTLAFSEEDTKAGPEPDPQAGLAPVNAFGYRRAMKRRGLLTFLLGLMSLTVAAAVAPGPPHNLSANVSGNAVTLTWQPPSTGGVPTGYVVEASLTPGGAAIARVPVSVPTLVVAHVPNGIYYVRVLGVNSDGSSEVSNELIVPIPGSGGGCSSPPNVPTNLNSKVSGNLITLAWAPAVSGCPATDYIVQAGSQPGLNDVAIVNVGAATTLSASAPPGTYYVRVVAVNAFGTARGASNETALSIDSLCHPPILAPALSLPVVSGNTFSINWLPSGGDVEGYIIEAGTASGTTNLLNIMVKGTSYTTNNAPTGTVYVRVRPVNACGTGPASNEAFAAISGPGVTCAPNSAACGQ